MIVVVLAGIATGLVMGLAWIYSPVIFGILFILLLLGLLWLVIPEEEIDDDDLYSQEMRLDIQEEVREMLYKSQRKHKAKYIENALAAYQELYGKDDFYQEIWHEVYEEFYKEEEKENV